MIDFIRMFPEPIWYIDHPRTDFFNGINFLTSDVWNSLIRAGNVTF